MKHLWVVLVWSLSFISAVSAETDKVTSIKMSHISPFCPTVNRVSDQTRVSLPNMHEVLSANPQGVRVIRGNSPYTSAHVEELLDQGVGKVIVFKNFYNGKKKQELNRLYTDNGFQGEIIHLPLPWQADEDGNFDDVEACKLVVKALKVVGESQVPVFFHCTVGEDRTGMLAGLMRIIFDGWTLQEAFQKEMCARGYEAGNPEKANEQDVVWAIRKNLTPLFLKVATLAKAGTLSESSCEQMPSKMIDGLQPEQLECSPVQDSSKICTK